MRSVLFVVLRGVAAFAAVAITSLTFMQVGPARAQSSADESRESLPAIDVISTRIGTAKRRSSSSGGARTGNTDSTSGDGNAVTSEGEIVAGGVAGTSTTIITSQEIERAPQSTLQDTLSREAGIQTNSLYGGVNGTGTIVDMRGFGVTAPSNTLVLVDGRRFNDSDLTGFDFSLIPRNSIDRIEITRGNSGGVLYGDGAVGGVINIVTKNGVGVKPNGMIEGSFGSLNTRDFKGSFSSSYNGWSVAAFGNSFRSDGYRVNNNTKQDQGVVDLRYTTSEGSAFFNIMADDLRQGLPGPRNILLGVFNDYVTDRRGSYSPFDYGNRQNLAMRGGVTRILTTGVELTVDGSYRKKQSQFGGFNPIPFLPAFAPIFYNESELSTMSITPRLNVDQTFGPVRARMIAGIDAYKTTYQSDRALFLGARPNHIYNLDQRSTAVYAQPTLTFWKNTDFAFGGRVQKNSLQARDTVDPTAPVGFPVPEGLPLNTSETNRATHLGFEHRFNPVFAVFGRMAQNFRVPNIDERVGMVSLFSGLPTNFNLRTQRSHDAEGGFRIHAGPFDMQTSVYRMVLTDELHFSPITFANVNLDPTLRRGVETSVSYKVTEAFRLKGTVTHTHATFRSGPFAGKEVPEVARWSGSAGFSWDVYQKYLVVDAVARFVGKRWMDGDEANLGAMRVPSYGVVDVRLAGEYQNFFWALSVQNLFDKLYFDYGLDQGFGFLSVYPLPGRTIQFKLGARFG
jgi:iron complex outermembrane recepter protein